MWEKCVQEYFNDREYRFDSNPYKYGYKKPREVKTLKQIYAEYPRLRDKIEGKKDSKKKTRRKSKR